MSKIVHARLDTETQQVLARLRRRTGMNDSQLIRRALHVLVGAPAGKRERRVIGLGAFESGLDDLGSNKRHLAGFGSK